MIARSPPIQVLGAARKSGVILQRFPGADWGEVLVLRTQSDGKVLVGGTAAYGPYKGGASFPAFTTGVTRFDWVLSRYNADGSPDTSWGVGGLVRTPFGVEDAELTDLAVLASGKVLASGIWYDQAGGVWKALVCRYNTDGTLDLTFGSFGVAFMPDTAAFYFSQVKVGVQSTGNVIVAGTRMVTSQQGRFIVWCLRPNGALNTTFGTGGTTQTAHNVNNDCRLWAMLVQSDDKIVLGGYTDMQAPGTGQHQEWMLARLSAAGLPDTGWGGVGADGNVVLLDWPQQLNATVQALLQEAGGKIVAVGQAARDALATRGHQALALARFSTAGVLDGTFGTSGTTLFGNSGVQANDGPGFAAFYDGAGKLVTGATSWSDTATFHDDGESALLARASALGVPDTGLSGDGIAPLSLASSTNEPIYGAALAQGGNYLLGGHVLGASTSSEAAALCQVRGDGTFDPAFGQPGGFTPPAAPTATLGSVSGITQTGATLSGTGTNYTSLSYRYGLTAQYGLRSSTGVLTGLLSGKAYHWQVVADGPGGQAFSADGTFTTSSGGTNVLLHDSFTDADGTDLRGHTPDTNWTGGFWQFGYQSATVQGNKVQCASGGVMAYLNCGLATGYTVSCDFTWNGGGFVCLLLRFSNTSNYWSVEITGTAFRIQERVTGAGSVRDTISFTPVNGNTYTVSVTTSGSNITATVTGGSRALTYGTFSSLSGNLTVGFEVDSTADRADVFDLQATG